MFRREIAWALSAVVLLLLLASPTAAQIVTWDGAGAIPPDGTFGVAANWNPDQVPGSTDQAIFDINDVYIVEFDANHDSSSVLVSAGTVSFESDSTSVRDYTLGGPFSVRGGALNVGADTLPVAVSTLGPIGIGDTVGSGTVDVTGAGSALDVNCIEVIHVIATQGFDGTLRYLDGAQGSITGTLDFGVTPTDGSDGTLEVLTAAGLSIAELNLATTTSTSTAQVTVDGLGSTLNQTDASTLDVGSASGGTGTIDVTNEGTFSSGTGAITVGVTGAINIATGTTGGTFDANGPMVIDGGSLTRDATGDFELAAGLTLSATNDAQIDFVDDYQLNDGTTFELGGGADLTVGRFLDIGSSGGNGTLVADGAGTSVTASSNMLNLIWGLGGFTADVTFRNHATGTFGAIDLATASTAGTTGILNIESGATITTSGLFVSAVGGDATTGVINLDGAGSSLTQIGASILELGHPSSGTATLNVTGDSSYISGTGMEGLFDAIHVGVTGTINIGTGATGGTFNALGPMTIEGTVNLIDGALNASMITLDVGGAFNFTGGVVAVNGFVGNLNNLGGTLAPGGSPGITNVAGEYTNQSGATVQVEIDSNGGVAGTDFDQVNITSSANLDGSLFADVGFTPAHQDSFEVMTFASHSGVFSSVTDSGLPDMLVMAPFYSATDLTLSVELLGDASGNGQVGPEDYTLWANAFGIAEPSYDDGDFNRDGMVGPADYTLWANQFGSVVMGPALAEPVAPNAVPEPSAAVLLLIGAAVLLWRRR